MFAMIKDYIRLWMEPTLKNGDMIKNRYKICEILGIGSYGISYLAIDLPKNKQIVVKQARKSKSESFYEREQEILSVLHHPNIPERIDYFHENGHIYIVMEYIDGKTFEKLIFQDGMQYDEKASFQILFEILTIVNYIHDKGIIHRDLRIPNIIDKDGEIFIIDFGLARYSDEPDTENYKHIEKRLQREIHVRSDFYSLGHFLLFLLYSSYIPNTRHEKSWEEELDISNEARQIIRRMLQLDFPYDHIQELIDDVNLIIDKKNVSVF